MEGGADSAAGWKALAELQYQSRNWQDAFTTSVKGLEWSQRRRCAQPSACVAALVTGSAAADWARKLAELCATSHPDSCNQTHGAQASQACELYHEKQIRPMLPASGGALSRHC